MLQVPESGESALRSAGSWSPPGSCSPVPSRLRVLTLRESGVAQLVGRAERLASTDQHGRCPGHRSVPRDLATVDVKDLAGDERGPLEIHPGRRRSLGDPPPRHPVACVGGRSRDARDPGAADPAAPRAAARPSAAGAVRSRSVPRPHPSPDRNRGWVSCRAATAAGTRLAGLKEARGWRVLRSRAGAHCLHRRPRSGRSARGCASRDRRQSDLPADGRSHRSVRGRSQPPQDESVSLG
jgi:hypothetical protein